jgi:regulator of replication initiation timing
MKKPDLQAFVLIVVFAVMLTVGCGPQSTGLLTEEPPSVKKSRTIAAENIELRKQLAQSSKEIEKLKDQSGKEIDEQKKLLAECLQDKEALKKKSRQNIRNQVKGVLDTVLEENKKLREENAKLKARIEALQKQPQ